MPATARRQTPRFAGVVELMRLVGPVFMLPLALLLLVTIGPFVGPALAAVLTLSW